MEHLLCVNDDVELVVKSETLSTVLWECPKCHTTIKHWFDKDLWKDR